MHFKHVTKKDISLLKKWFEQDYIAEHWYGEGLKNTYDTIHKFTHQIPCIFTLWLAFDKDIPFGYLMISAIDKSDPFYGRHLPEGAKGITLDLLIGDTRYLGKGLCYVMIQELLLQHYQDVDFVFIDPAVDNQKAIHIYKKVGFLPIEEFEPSWDPGSSCLLMILSMKDLLEAKK